MKIKEYVFMEFKKQFPNNNNWQLTFSLLDLIEFIGDESILFRESYDMIINDRIFINLKQHLKKINEEDLKEHELYIETKEIQRRPFHRRGNEVLFKYQLKFRRMECKQCLDNIHPVCKQTMICSVCVAYSN